MSAAFEQIEWRPATGEEITTYYREEFPKQVANLPAWITPDGPMEYAIAFQDRYPVVQSNAPDKNQNSTRQFIRRSTRRGENMHVFDGWQGLLDMFLSPAHNDPLRSQQDNPQGALIDPNTASPDLFDGGEVAPPPVTKAAYYSLNHHDRPWVLMFDIDAKDIAKIGHRNTGGDLENGSLPDESRIVTDTPRGFQYRFEHIKAAIDYAFDLSEWLQTTMEFEEIQVVYSGQGAHVYGLDTDPYQNYDSESRRRLSKGVAENLAIPIDEQVTPDKRRVARIPFSLHADVSRIVTPISSRDFDFKTQAIPPFLNT